MCPPEHLAEAVLLGYRAVCPHRTQYGGGGRREGSHPSRTMEDECRQRGEGIPAGPWDRRLASSPDARKPRTLFRVNGHHPDTTRTAKTLWKTKTPIPIYKP